MTEQAPGNELVELMRKREERESKEFERQEGERKEQRDAHDRRVISRMEGDKFYWTEMFDRQSRCDHRKGTSGPGPKAKHIDYNVSRHVFANGVTQIKCLKCKHKSFPGDTQSLCHGSMDAYIANTKSGKGPQLKNPTKRSYNDFYNMTLEENTTNKETRAEIVTKGPQLVTA